MNKAMILLLAIVLFSACSQQSGDEGAAKDAVSAAAEQADAPKRDISDETLISIDPAIEEYTDRIAATKSAYEGQPDEEGKAELVRAYITFADYMTYESPVSPREGKYHRALIEYRHALDLDPCHVGRRGDHAGLRLFRWVRR